MAKKREAWGSKVTVNSRNRKFCKKSISHPQERCKKRIYKEMRIEIGSRKEQETECRPAFMIEMHYTH